MGSVSAAHWLIDDVMASLLLVRTDLDVGQLAFWIRQRVAFGATSGRGRCVGLLDRLSGYGVFQFVRNHVVVVDHHLGERSDQTARCLIESHSAELTFGHILPRHIKYPHWRP